MDTISISQLKVNPSRALNLAVDYPIEVKNHEETKAYLIGKELFETIMTALEDLSHRAAVSATDFRKGRDFEDVARELGI